MVATPDSVLAEAARWLGYEESSDGGEYTFSPEGGFGPESQWCGLFQEHNFRSQGAEPGGPVIPRLYYTPSAAQDFADRGRWFFEPQRADLVLFNWEGYGLNSGIGLIDHIGIVEDTSTWGAGYITTIEGNIYNSNGTPAVGRFQRSVDVISGFGRPAWQSVTPPKPVYPAVNAGPWTGVAVSQSRVFYGARSKDVEWVQRALRAQGVMSVDVWYKEKGFYGKGTKAAMGAFQFLQGHMDKDDGLPHTDVLRKLGFYVLGKGQKGVIHAADVQLGANNWAVLLIRQRLWAKGYHNQTGPLSTRTDASYVDSYANYQRDLGYPGTQASGKPDVSSLQKLLPDYLIAR